MASLVNIQSVSLLLFLFILCIIRVSLFKIPYWILFLLGSYFLLAFPSKKSTLKLKLNSYTFTKAHVFTSVVTIYTGIMVTLKLVVFVFIIVGISGFLSFFNNSEIKNQLFYNVKFVTINNHTNNYGKDRDNNNNTLSKNSSSINYRKSNIYVNEKQSLSENLFALKNNKKKKEVYPSFFNFKSVVDIMIPDLNENKNDYEDSFYVEEENISNKKVNRIEDDEDEESLKAVDLNITKINNTENNNDDNKSMISYGKDNKKNSETEQQVLFSFSIVVAELILELIILSLSLLTEYTNIKGKRDSKMSNKATNSNNAYITTNPSNNYNNVSILSTQNFINNNNITLSNTNTNNNILPAETTINLNSTITLYKELKSFQTEKFFMYVLFLSVQIITIILNVSLINSISMIFFLSFLLLLILFPLKMSYPDYLNKFFTLVIFVINVFHYTKNISLFKADKLDFIIGFSDFSNILSMLFFIFQIISYFLSSFLQRYSYYDREMELESIIKLHFKGILENSNNNNANRESILIVNKAKTANKGLYLNRIKFFFIKSDNFLAASSIYKLFLLFWIVFKVCLVMFFNFICFLFYGTNKARSKYKNSFLLPTFYSSLILTLCQFIYNMNGVFLFTNFKIYSYLEIIGLHKYYKFKVNDDFSNILELDINPHEKILGMLFDLTVLFSMFILCFIIVVKFNESDNKERKDKSKNVNPYNVFVDQYNNYVDDNNNSSKTQDGNNKLNNLNNENLLLNTVNFYDIQNDIDKIDYKENMKNKKVDISPFSELSPKRLIQNSNEKESK